MSKIQINWIRKVHNCHTSCLSVAYHVPWSRMKLTNTVAKLQNLHQEKPSVSGVKKPSGSGFQSWKTGIRTWEVNQCWRFETDTRRENITVAVMFCHLENVTSQKRSSKQHDHKSGTSRRKQYWPIQTIQLSRSVIDLRRLVSVSRHPLIWFLSFSLVFLRRSAHLFITLQERRCIL